MTNSDRRSSIPGVQRLLAASGYFPSEEHAFIVATARTLLADERDRVAVGHTPRSLRELAGALREGVDARRFSVPTAINATGVILHTSLGRAPWSKPAIDAAVVAARGYVMLELDRTTGRRARRFPLVDEYLTELTGAEAATVVNNNAAAVALAVRLAGRRRAVAVARSDLVEIGGGVRIPEIISRAGAKLVEVGTTNRTKLSDFRKVLADGTARAILHVHASNFRMEGFVDFPTLQELAALARQYAVPLVCDIGSGALLDTAAFGLAREPMPTDAVRHGVDVVTFSGDKLIGGPQAGLIVGRRDLIERIRRDVLGRATRLDKVSLAGLAATLDSYRRGTALTEIPVWRMIATPLESVEKRARDLRDALDPLPATATVQVAEMTSVVGGGSLPGDSLASVGLAISSSGLDNIAASLRNNRPAVVGRVADGKLLLDLRTVAAEDDSVLTAAVAMALREA